MTERSSNTLMSLRVIVEGLAVAGIIWLASSVTQQNVAIARLQTQVSQLNASLADVPRLSRDLAVAQSTIADQSHRLDRLESRSHP